MEQNKTGKYLKYAVGEIVLVVVGILIALSINNWNEERKREIKEIEIVKLIYDELEANSNYIDKRSKEFESKLPFARDLLNLTGSNAKSIPTDSIAKYTVKLFSISAYNPFTTNLDRLINGEEFNLIKYDSLQVMLSKYRISLDKSHLLNKQIQSAYNRIELIEYQIMTFEFNRQVGEKYNFKTYDEITNLNFNIDTKDILSNPKIAAMISRYLNVYHFLLYRFKEINEDIQTLQNYIEAHYDF